MQIPATNLKDAFNACDPTQPLPAGDDRYVDLAPGRGDEGGAVSQCCRRILFSDHPLVQLFGGHRGCGKSTELRRLQARLEEQGYFVVYVEAERDLDLEDTEPTDVLLSLVRSLDAKLREESIHLSKKHLKDLLLWFAEVVLEKTETKQIAAEVRSEAEVSGSVPLLAKVLARFSGWIKTGSESKKLVRQRLDPQISQLLDRARIFAEAARFAVQDQGKGDLVLIVDSLDRVALKSLSDGRSSHEVLFIERGELLKGLACHTVVTVPISLLFSPKVSSLHAIFPDRHLLPMVKTQERSSRAPWPVGEGLLKKMLGERVVLDAVFDEGVPEQLIRASGGHPRYLMMLARNAFDFVDELPVTEGAAAKAIRRLENDFGRSIPEEHWPLLAEVHRTQQARNDAEHQLMLFNLSVLEYQNHKRWCDVHPAVLSLPAFQEALRRGSEEVGAGQAPQAEEGTTNQDEDE